MNPLIIEQFGARLRVSRARLCLDSRLMGDLGSWEARRLPFDSIVFLTHSGMLSLDAIRWLQRQRIPIFFLEWNGRLQSCILHGSKTFGRLRIAQYQAYANERRRKEIARAIVKEKIRRSEEVLAVLGHPTILKWGEAQSAVVYWAVMDDVFAEIGYEFGGRRNSEGYNKQASNIVNACLNYSYGVLEGLIRVEINSSGLDESVSFLHHMHSHSLPLHQPLAFDLLELWRPYADLAVVHLLQSSKMTARDFWREEDLSIRLKPETARRVVEGVSESFGSNFQTSIQEAIQLLARYLTSGHALEFAFVRVPSTPLLHQESALPYP